MRIKNQFDMRYLFRLIVVLFLLGNVSLLKAQEEVVPNNQEVFDDFLYRRGNQFRSASGVPGPQYWQNTADYTIEVELDDKTDVIKGKVTLFYTNNSPEKLPFIWMYVEQNLFTEQSKGNLTTQGGRYKADTDGGVKISNLSAKVNKSTSSEHYITDTRMKVTFAQPIPANGGKATVSMNFEFKIPENGVDRMGKLETENGKIYAIAQWYPRVAVFDDVSGWNTEPYLGAGEFYCEYGDFDYKITAPYNHIVVASGTLQNPKEVLTKIQIERLDKASKSDTTVMILPLEEVGKTNITRPKQSGKLTWHYKINNTRDVAFASSASFIWDAAKIDLPSGKTITAQSVYPKESHGQNAWSRSTEYTKASIEFYSDWLFEYPYPTAINVACNVGGMEYPGVSFCHYRSRGAGLWGVTDHEFGHNWFPMIVGSNERKHAWLDEGFNTFINHYSTRNFNQGEYPSDEDKGKNRIAWMTWKNREAVSTFPDITKGYNLAYTAYYKPATGLILLREYILNPKIFDEAFKGYVETWAYKHPQPTDFFNYFENVTGENLNWFWRTFFYSNGNIDLAIDSVEKRENGTRITFLNNGEIPMPITFEVTFSDGSKQIERLPVEIWQRNSQWIYLLNSDKEVTKVEIDPKGFLPDKNASDNVWSNN